jgi:hypothetical protein
MTENKDKPLPDPGTARGRMYRLARKIDGCEDDGNGDSENARDWVDRC